MIKKDSGDFTCGSVNKKLINFTIPIALGNILMQLYNYVDSVIVGRCLGKEALAAVGASAPLVFMLVSLVIGISIGSTIIIGQCYGKNDKEGIRKATDSLYVFLLVAAAVIGAICYIFNEDILRLIGLPETVIPHGVEYLNITLIGFIFLFLFNAISAILRGVGDSKTPLVFLAVSSVVNIGLDLLFVVVLKLGITGVAWATVIAQFVAVLFAFSYTSRKNQLINCNLLALKFDKKVFAKSVKIGIPAGLQQLFVGMGMLALMGCVTPFGTAAIAGYSAACRIEGFVTVIPTTFSMAITSFTSQNYGAALFDRVKLGVYATVKMSLITSTLIMVLLSAFATPLMKMFTTDSEVIATGVGYIYVLAPSFYLFSLMFTYTGVLRGMGNTIVPMLTTLVGLWLVRVPVALSLSKVMGEIGIWLSSPLSWGVAAIVGYIYYHRALTKQIIKRGITKES